MEALLMYVSRIVYEGCCSFQDMDSCGSSLPNSLFNLTQNYYYLPPANEDCITCDDTNNVREGGN